MSNFINTVKIWYKKITTISVSYNRHGIRPSRDWKVILIATQLFIVVLAGIALYFYIKVDKGEFFSIKKSKNEYYFKIDMDLLNKTVKDLNDREASLKQIKENNIAPPDPSI